MSTTTCPHVTAVVTAQKAQCERQLSIAIKAYNGLARRPRAHHAWAYVQCQLWNARADAVSAGVLVRGTDAYRWVSDRYTDATQRVESQLPLV